MSQRDHLRIEDYATAAKRPDGVGVIARQTQEHLVAVCKECRAEWVRLGALRAAYLERLNSLAGPPADPPSKLEIAATPDEIELQEFVTAELIRIYRNVLNEKSELLGAPAERRALKIRRARIRFRTPLLAEMLIEECRKRVRDAPAEAAEIASLVPEVLGWSEKVQPVPTEAPSLLARAAALHANALRVAGDLQGAERAFAQLREKLAHRPLADLSTVAEIASLEASLYIDLRQFELAEDRLTRAAMGYRTAANEEGLARTTIKQANFMGHLGRHDEVVRLLDLAELQPALAADPHLFLCAITARITSLCEVNKFTQAGAVLDSHVDHYEQSEDALSGAILRCLKGRIALGLGAVEAAEQALRDAQEAMLFLGRGYDAALITLYLAEALHLAGKHRELARLAGSLAATFLAKGVEGEALSAMKLLSQAAATDSLTSSLLASLRLRLASPASSTDRPALRLA